MSQIKNLILSIFFLSLAIVSFGQELKRTNDSLIIKKATNSKLDSKKTKGSNKQINSSNATRKNYLFKKDTTNSKRTVQSIRKKVIKINDSLSPIKNTDKHKKQQTKKINKTDSLYKKLRLKNQ